MFGSIEESVAPEVNGTYHRKQIFSVDDESDCEKPLGHVIGE